jgi:hypothetical protein
VNANVGINIMRQLFLRLAGIVAACILVLVVGWIWFFAGHGFRVAKFERIQKGMTKAEVVDIMGEGESDGSGTHWFYGSYIKCCRGIVHFADGATVEGKFHDH